MDLLQLAWCRCALVYCTLARSSDWVEHWEQYQHSPESTTGNLLCLIEPNLLKLENKLKISYSLQALTRVAQLKETIAVWHQIEGPQTYFSFPFHNTSGLWCHPLQQRRVSVFSRVLKSNRAGGSGFLWDVCCSLHHSEAEHDAILSEGFQINTSFCFKALNSLSKAVPQLLCANLILRECAAAF